jgi:hypothetical protein
MDRSIRRSVPREGLIEMRRLFYYVLSAVMIGLFGLAAIALYKGVSSYQAPASGLTDDAGNASSRGLPKDFEEFAVKAQQEENQACSAAEQARDAASNATNSDATQAVNAAREAASHTGGYGILRGKTVKLVFTDPQNGAQRPIQFNFVYQGQLKGDDVKDGYGIETYYTPDGDPDGSSYEGHWKDGKYDSGVEFGVVSDGKRSVYAGEFIDGSYSSGVYWSRNGTTFSGQFERNWPSGYGVLNHDYDDNQRQLSEVRAIITQPWRHDELTYTTIRYKNDGHYWIQEQTHSKPHQMCVRMDIARRPELAGYCDGTDNDNPLVGAPIWKAGSDDTHRRIAQSNSCTDHGDGIGLAPSPTSVNPAQ